MGVDPNPVTKRLRFGSSMSSSCCGGEQPSLSIFFFFGSKSLSILKLLRMT